MSYLIDFVKKLVSKRTSTSNIKVKGVLNKVRKNMRVIKLKQKMGM